MARVTLRYWAAAKDAAGVAEETVDAADVAAALAAGLQAAHARTSVDGPSDRGDRLSRVIARSSFIVNGDPVGSRPPESVTLAEGAVIEVLPPFAGG